MDSTAAKRALFKHYHENGCFVIPNPWDVGSARYLASLGFKALATTSAGYAFSEGLPDSNQAVSLDVALSHYSKLANSVDVPVNADFQDGYAKSLNELQENVRRCIETGVAGFSIEDATGESHSPLYEFEEAVDRIRAVRSAIDTSGSAVVLTARSECFLVGHDNPLEESIRRLQAYAEAGADVLFAPCPATADLIKPILGALDPMPVNVIVSGYTGLNVQDLAAMGVRRISVGSALARSAWTGFMNSAVQLAENGSFEGLQDLRSFSELNQFFLSKNS